MASRKQTREYPATLFLLLVEISKERADIFIDNKLSAALNAWALDESPYKRDVFPTSFHNYISDAKKQADGHYKCTIEIGNALAQYNGFLSYLDFEQKANSLKTYLQKRGTFPKLSTTTIYIVYRGVSSGEVKAKLFQPLKAMDASVERVELKEEDDLFNRIHNIKKNHEGLIIVCLDEEEKPEKITRNLQAQDLLIIPTFLTEENWQAFNEMHPSHKEILNPTSFTEILAISLKTDLLELYKSTSINPNKVVRHTPRLLTTIQKSVDRYTMQARILPAFYNTIPLLVLSWTTLFYLGLLSSTIEWIVLVGITAIYPLFLYQIGEWFATISKQRFERILFNNRLSFPTVSLLLFHNKKDYVGAPLFSKLRKEEFREKAKTRLGMKLMNEKEEKENPEEARRLIYEAVGKLKELSREDALLFRQNIRYGFSRNLLGGALLGGLTSLVLFILTLFWGNYLIAAISLLFGSWLGWRRIKWRSMLETDSVPYADRLINWFLTEYE